MSEFLSKEYSSQKVHPKKEDLFAALNLTSYADVKMLILGQDPYPGDGRAHGLSFSVLKPMPPPKTLGNIFTELKADLDLDQPGHGDLTAWAKQGVLLLNTVLSVRDGEEGAHKNKGWEPFTDAIIKAVNDKSEPVVFVLWGVDAQVKKKLITNPIHDVLEASHPSNKSVSISFRGSKPFSKINAFLEKKWPWRHRLEDRLSFVMEVKGFKRQARCVCFCRFS